MESHQNIQCLDLDYLSRSASLHVPWDTRICSLPRAAPGTGRTDGTCWARMGHGRQHRWDLDTHTNIQIHLYKNHTRFNHFLF